MPKTIRELGAVFLVLGVTLSSGLARAEVLEEIMAWVNGDIITKSEYDEEEKGRLAEAQRQFTGEELDREVKSLKEQLLMQMIDRKIQLQEQRSLAFREERLLLEAKERVNLTKQP